MKPFLHKEAMLSLYNPSSSSNSPLTNERFSKTILLVDGEAMETVSYRLELKPEEKLKNMFHVTNDTSIVTKHYEELKKIQQSPHTVYNISLTHEFEGNVGIVSFMLRIITSQRRYIVSGTFNVAGIVANIVTNGSEEIASGMGSKGLSFSSPREVSFNSTVGQIPLSVVFQGPGSDTLSNQLSLSEIIQGSEVEINVSEGEENFPLLNTICKAPQSVVQDGSGFYIFNNSSCGVGFDYENGILVLNLNQERGGSVAIEIMIPAITVRGEVFETVINVFVGKPTMPLPVVVSDEDIELLLDFYGNEEFSLNMYNTLSPPQKENASLYLVDLPNGRFARADFQRSRFEYPNQIIVFKTAAPGNENENMRQLLKGSATFMEYPNTRRMQAIDEFQRRSIQEEVFLQAETPGRNPDMNIEETRYRHGNSKWNPIFGSVHVFGDVKSINALGHDLSLQDSSYTEATLKEALEPTTHESKVHVLLPPSQNIVTAVNQNKRKIKTTFEPNTIASIKAATEDSDENVEVGLHLKGYSKSNFSQFKSDQISQSIERQVSDFANGTSGNATLVRLENDNGSLKLYYYIAVVGNSSQIAASMDKNRTVEESIANDARLSPGSITEISARSFHSRGVMNSANGVGVVDTISAPLGGGFIAAIVVVCCIILIPIAFICYGSFVNRRRREDMESSDMNSNDITGPGVRSNTPEVEVEKKNSHEILRDEFGRLGEDDTQESFKMQKEMFKRGYFGDNGGENV